MTEMYTRCWTPARDAARTRFPVASSSPLGPPARCRTVPAPATADSTPSSLSRSPVTYSMPSPDSWLSPAQDPYVTPGVPQERHDEAAERARAAGDQKGEVAMVVSNSFDRESDSRHNQRGFAGLLI